MGLVIRVLYNNQSWQAPCKQPGKDALCWLCFEDNVAIKAPLREDEICSGHCWEQYLCTQFRWGCTPKGRIFGGRAHIDQKVFLVYKQRDGNYTLWGKTTVQAFDPKPVEEGGDDEVGFAFVHLNPFEPLPKEKWIHNLSDIQLVGEKWLMGRYRYIDAEHETYLEKSIERPISEHKTGGPAIALPVVATRLDLMIAPNIREKLESIASEEGREIDEIVRQAIAEWIKLRKL